MLFLISSCTVLTLAMSSVASSDLDKWRKDELLIKLFSSIKLCFCLKPWTALQSSNLPCSPVIPGSNLNIHSIEDHASLSMIPVATVESPLNPCKPVHRIHNILWQAFPQPNAEEIVAFVGPEPATCKSRLMPYLALGQEVTVTIAPCSVPPSQSGFQSNHSH